MIFGPSDAEFHVELDGIKKCLHQKWPKHRDSNGRPVNNSKSIPCCCLLLATCLMHLAYLGCAFLLDGQKIRLSYTCSCQFLPCHISLPWCMVAKLVRKVARSMQQHGITHWFLFCYSKISPWRCVLKKQPCRYLMIAYWLECLRLMWIHFISRV